MNPLSHRLRTILADGVSSDFVISKETRLAADLSMPGSQRIALTYRLECEFDIKLDSDAFDAITSREATAGDVLAVVERLSTATHGT